MKARADGPGGEECFARNRYRKTAVDEIGEQNLFRKLPRSERLKIKLLSEYAYKNFLFLARNDTGEVLVAQVRDTHKSFKPWPDDFLDGIDRSKLRQGIDVRQVMRIIRWVGGGALDQ